MKTTDNIAVLIMAAGQSSRMKSVKQLLPWNNTNMLVHTLKTLLEVQRDRVFMVLGANSSLIENESKLHNYPVTLISNKTWDKGLGNSIACGIKTILKQEMDIKGILICLADQPLLTAHYYKNLSNTFKTNKFPIVATKYSNKYGVPAIFSTKIAQELLHLKEDVGARLLMSKYKEDILALDAGEQLTDIDTLETYQKLYKLHNTDKE
ncbi:NTP transferase domain-containing protein [Maribacter chungangensis]|uniref:NTP transferase domain-containing protein n=1 Tax=Maribacter chungangensis TaxID=1069117 RepID=A0ABW3B482_9FLAO